MSESTTPAWDRAFFPFMGALIALLVVLGFRLTVNDNLFHPDWPRPVLLWVHALIFTAWILLFFAQTALVYARQIKAHRQLGLWSLGLGSALPVVGVATAFLMARLRAQHGEADAANFLLISCFDMLAFSISFGLAARWRRQREWHRRLMFIATCTLASAAFFRLLPPLVADDYVYGGVDALVLAGALRDLLADGRVHRVYLVALPLLVLGQSLTMSLHLAPAWLELARQILG